MSYNFFFLVPLGVNLTLGWFFLFLEVGLCCYELLSLNHFCCNPSFWYVIFLSFFSRHFYSPLILLMIHWLISSRFFNLYGFIVFPIYSYVWFLNWNVPLSCVRLYDHMDRSPPDSSVRELSGQEHWSG